MATTSTNPERAAARERVALAGGAALLAAGLVLVGAVLPAEYGVDPLGIGARLGLTAIGDVEKKIAAFEAGRAAGAGGVPIVVPQDRPFQRDTATFTLGPHESVEYKYRLAKGQALLYSWNATAVVNYELHAEPDGAPAGYAETYEKRNGVATASGTLTAPFPGIHGWYWENASDVAIAVTLSAAGFFIVSHEFHTNSPPKTRMFQ